MSTHKAFHVSLTVRDVAAAAQAYQRILGAAPTRVEHDYARFELSDPPVVLSLNASEEPGKVAHLGIRYGTSGEMLTERARCQREGVDVIDQPNAECCYARADKFWIRDDDGMLWEMYVKHGDVDAQSAADRDLGTTAV